MFIDRSRIKDLEQIQKLLDDPKQPEYRKRRYARTRARILQQLKNPELAKQRERLIKAIGVHDQAEAHKLQLQIKNLTKEEAVIQE